MWFFYDRKQQTVAERREAALKALKRLQKKRPEIEPISIEGRKLVNSFWGKAWNDNLENYEDFSYRLERGRSYVRNNSVLHLSIQKGHIHSLVHGSEKRPYKIDIKIKPISTKGQQKIFKSCSGHLEHLDDLLAGHFPQELAKILLKQKEGLFPLAKEIYFSCSCPDWADVCKHVAATLYGVGARLDHSPESFFSLRGIDLQVFFKKVVHSKVNDILSLAKKARNKYAIHATNKELSEIFGITIK